MYNTLKAKMLQEKELNNVIWMNKRGVKKGRLPNDPKYKYQDLLRESIHQILHVGFDGVVGESAGS